MISPEPRFAKIAAMIGDPTRARMLSALRGGQYLAAGELDVARFEGLLARGTLVACDGHFALSAGGRDELQRLGIAVPAVTAASAQRFAYACLDWSERRDHLAGHFAVALLDHAVAQGWLRRTPGSRALTLTAPGAKAMAPWIGARGAAPATSAAPHQLVSQPS